MNKTSSGYNSVWANTSLPLRNESKYKSNFNGWDNSKKAIRSRTPMKNGLRNNFKHYSRRSPTSLNSTISSNNKSKNRPIRSKNKSIRHSSRRFSPLSRVQILYSLLIMERISRNRRIFHWLLMIMRSWRSKHKSTHHHQKVTSSHLDITLQNQEATKINISRQKLPNRLNKPISHKTQPINHCNLTIVKVNKIKIETYNQMKNLKSKINNHRSRMRNKIKISTIKFMR